MFPNSSIQPLQPSLPHRSTGRRVSTALSTESAACWTAAPSWPYQASLVRTTRKSAPAWTSLRARPGKMSS